jgi:hypothetical protein
MTMLTIPKVTYFMFPGLTKSGFAKNLKISFQFVVLLAFVSAFIVHIIPFKRAVTVSLRVFFII